MHWFKKLLQPKAEPATASRYERGDARRYSFGPALGYGPEPNLLDVDVEDDHLESDYEPTVEPTDCGSVSLKQPVAVRVLRQVRDGQWLVVHRDAFVPGDILVDGGPARQLGPVSPWGVGLVEYCEPRISLHKLARHYASNERVQVGDLVLMEVGSGRLLWHEVR
jgi:hypothetical protein